MEINSPTQLESHHAHWADEADAIKPSAARSVLAFMLSFGKVTGKAVGWLALWTLAGTVGSVMGDIYSPNQADVEYRQKSEALTKGLYEQSLSCLNLGEKDPLCGTARDLTAGEKRMLRDVFGPDIPVDDIRIRFYNNDKAGGFVHPAISDTLIHINTSLMRGSVTVNPDGLYTYSSEGWLSDISLSYSGVRETFIHEAAHVMQELGYLPYGTRADPYDPHRYEYTIVSGRTLRDYNNEQGASIVAAFAIRVMDSQVFIEQYARDNPGRSWPETACADQNTFSGTDRLFDILNKLETYTNHHPMNEIVSRDMPHTRQKWGAVFEADACSARAGAAWLQATYPEQFRHDPQGTTQRALTDYKQRVEEALQALNRR